MHLQMAIEEIRDIAAKQAQERSDCIVDMRHMEMTVDGEKTQVRLANEGPFDVNDHAHDQLAELLGMPLDYYYRMRSVAPDFAGKQRERLAEPCA